MALGGSIVDAFLLLSAVVPFLIGDHPTAVLTEVAHPDG